MGSFKVEYNDVRDFLKKMSDETGIETTISNDEKGNVSRELVTAKSFRLDDRPPENVFIDVNATKFVILEKNHLKWNGENYSTELRCCGDYSDSWSHFIVDRKPDLLTLYKQKLICEYHKMDEKLSQIEDVDAFNNLKRRNDDKKRELYYKYQMLENIAEKSVEENKSNLDELSREK